MIVTLLLYAYFRTVGAVAGKVAELRAGHVRSA
jgi:hypothetical protein